MRWGIGAAAAAVLGCGEDASEPVAEEPTGAECAPPNRWVGDRCIEPGIQDDGCPAGTVGTVGGCRAAGIPPELCSPGFVAAGDGCEPVLPGEPCAAGWMAIPGEQNCREVTPCAPGTWGNIPVDGATEHVDAAYAGGMSDGSATNPWITIGDAVAAAAPGAVVAIAAGSYVENVLVTGKPVRLWGVCPARVEIRASQAAAAVDVQLGANGTEVRGVALVGNAAQGLRVGAEDVLAEDVWLHGGDTGVVVADQAGPASLTLRGALVEQTKSHTLAVYGGRAEVDASLLRGQPPGDPGVGNGFQGIWVVGGVGPAQLRLTSSVVELTRECGVCALGSEVEIVASVVRRILPSASDLQGGEGVLMLPRARLTMRGSFVDEAHTSGVQVSGSDADIEALVVRGTLPQAADQKLGRGLAVESYAADGVWERASVTATSSVIEDNHSRGVFLRAADAMLEGFVVRGTRPRASDQAEGWGVEVDDDYPGPAVATVRGSVIEDNHDIGLRLEASELTLQGCVVRGTQPRATDLLTGYGILVIGGRDRASAVIENSLVSANTVVGIVVLGSDASLANVVVSGTLPRPGDLLFGRGIDVHADALSGQRSTVSARSLLVEQNRDVGFFISDSDVTLEWSVVADTSARAADGLYGDGVAALSVNEPGAVLIVSASTVARSSRAGLSSFGAACGIGSSVLDCNGLHLVAELHEGAAATIDNLGDVRCGCGEQEEACKVLSASLAPPAPLE